MVVARRSPFDPGADVAPPIRQSVTRVGVDRDKLLAQINVIVHGLHCQLHDGTLYQ
jgi:hypothetical protein